MYNFLSSSVDRFFIDFGVIWDGLVVQVGAMLGTIYHPRGQAKSDSQNSTKWHGASARAQFRGFSGAQDDDQSPKIHWKWIPTSIKNLITY